MFKFKRGFVHITTKFFISRYYVHSLPLLYRIIPISPLDLSGTCHDAIFI
jgi:hypothetical protein